MCVISLLLLRPTVNPTLKHRLLAYPLLLALALLALSFGACNKEEEWVRTLDDITFSCEELDFDTVFTSCGTTTRQLKIYNRGNVDARIDRVTLQRGAASCFRLNVDGDTSLVARQIEIAAGDSCFVFVQATIDPNSGSAHFIETDTILLQSGSARRKLPLRACGRNAIYHLPDHTLQLNDGSYPLDNFGNPYRYSVIDCANWRHDLPHVVVGYAVVDSDSTLNLTAGDELYFYNDAVLWVYEGGTLNAIGTAEQPVLFTSLRHDGWYETLPGQWGYIWLSNGSHDNVIRHAVIENGTVGILADTNVGGNPTLTIDHCVIQNHALAGLIGQTAYIVGSDLLVHTCGTATLSLQYGGRYELDHCTLANYWTYSVRNNASVIVNNYLIVDDVEYLYPLPLVRFSNSIIYGSRSAGELLLDIDDRVTAVVDIDHTLVRGGDWDTDPRFMAPYDGDYHLSDDSPVPGLGYRFETAAVKYRSPGFVPLPQRIHQLAPPKKITLHP